MANDILGSMVVKETGFFKRKKTYSLVFLRDRVMGIVDDYRVSDYIDEETGDFDRLEVLEDGDNFEFSYVDIRQVTMKQSGWGGSIDFETWEGTKKFEIEKDQNYRNCVTLVRSALDDKVLDKSPAQATKYCPQCRDEFQPWVTECPDCGVALVDELPFLQEQRPETPGSNVLSYIDDSALNGLKLNDLDELGEDTMIEIVVAPNEMVAKMWQGLLQEQGIDSMLNFSDESSRGHTMAPNNSDCELLVRVEDARRAYSIIQPFLDA